MTRCTGVGRGRRNPSDDLMLRVLDRVLGRDGCWVWPGGRTAGYGYIQSRRSDGSWVPERVHRVVYERLVGPIPKGMVLDHRCHNEDPTCSGGDSCPHRACFNPAHLEVVTHLVNVERGKNREQAVHQARVCGRGHPYTAEHGYWRSDGRWRCSTCGREYQRDRRARAA